MEGNWRPQSQGDSSPMDATSAVDWRSQLQPEARQRIVNKIMETLKRHLPISIPEGVSELRKIAIRFEEKIYTAATSQSDYLRRISMKMLSMETKTQPPAPINPTNAGVNQNPPDSGSLGIQSQINNPGQPRQIMQQSLPSNSSAAMQGSSGLAPALTSMSGLAPSNISGVTQASNLQNMPGIPQTSVNNAIGQGSQTDMYANVQRQRQQQQQIISQQQQSQNPMMYQQHLQQQMLKKQLQQSSLVPPQMQQQQQQSLLPQNQLQSAQPSLMQISSNLQSNQSTMQQTQAANTQSAAQPGFQQNQLNQIQQPVPSLLQQNPQSVPRQQQVPSLQQQPASISQQSTLSQQHQPMGQQGNTSNMQQSQIHGQQNSIGDIQQQQQRLPIQQNNLLNMQQQQQLMNQQAMSLHQQQQQQLGSQNNMSGLQQQQQLLGSLPSTSNLQPHQRAMLLQKQQQQQAQHSSLSLLQSQGQQSQLQPSQQPLMSQFQSQPTQMQQQLLMQQPSSSLQREMQQRLQGPGSLLQAHNAMEQKPLIQTQRALQEVSSSTSVDSTAQTGHASAVDWQEECYQKVLSMKERYYADLSEFHHKINVKLQQQEALLPPGKQSDQYEKLKGYKLMLDRMLQLLQISSKNSVPIGLKEKLPMYEKQIVNMVNSQRHKKIPPQAQQFQHPNVGNAQPIPHQQPSQVSQMQLTDNHAKQVLQGPGTSLQPSGSAIVQHVSMPLSTAHQNISSGLPPSSNMDSVHGSSFNSRQPGAIGSGQGGLGSLQTSMSMSQQNNINALSQSASNASQANVGPMQTPSSVLQQQHIKQEQQQLLQTQQMKQLQQRQIQHQQTMQQQQRQQLLQHQQPLQQHLHQQQKQQQASQLPMHQIQQLHSMNELNELKARQGSGIKPGVYEYSAGQRHNYYNQQLKPGASYPVSSPQNLQASSPQISHQSSPQIDQNTLLSSISKVKAPMQSANSPLVVTPSTPFAPSPIPVDSEKPVSAISSAGHVGQQQAPVALPQSHSLAVSTPGISASPLLAECTSQDGNHAMPATSKTTERPVDRLIKMVQSLTPKSLTSSVSDIGSVVSMVDRIAGSAPGNGSRTAVGEDLVAMTKCRLQARNFMSQDGGAMAKKMKRHTSAMPLNNASSAGSVNEGFMKLYGFESSELESTATSRIKRLKPEVNDALLEEIKEINQKLIDTVVDVSDEDADSVVAAAEGAEGTVVKCSYTAVALSPDLKARFASAQMSPIMPMRLLVPSNYPRCSPILLDNLPVEPSRESEDLWSRAKSKFSISLRCLSQPMSLGEMVKTWDACARKVILDYAQQAGGGSFSSTYGSWEYCVGA